MYCLIISDECQSRELLWLCERSSDGMRTVLKSPAIIRLLELFSREKRLWKKAGSSLLGP